MIEDADVGARLTLSSTVQQEVFPGRAGIIQDSSYGVGAGTLSSDRGFSSDSLHGVRKTAKS